MASEPISLFVAGTDTGVGKTRVTAALLRALARHHPRVVGMKPVAAGLVMHQGQAVSEDVLALRAASTVAVPAAWDNPVALPEPLSPHLAAARCGQRLTLPPLLQAWQHLCAQADVVVVEGAGGWLAPLSDTETMASLAQAMAVPVVLVVGMRLGCLNHALLTARAIQADGLTLAGWVANTVDPQMACLAENVATLQARLPAPLLGLLPWQPEAEPDPSCLALPTAWTQALDKERA